MDYELANMFGETVCMLGIVGLGVGGMYYLSKKIVEDNLDNKEREINRTQELLQDPNYQNYLQTRKDLTEKLSSEGRESSEISSLVNNALGEFSPNLYDTKTKSETSSEF